MRLSGALAARLAHAELAASVFEHSHDGIMITALDGTILAVNRAFSAITGYTEAEVVGRNPRMLQSGRQSGDFYRAMWSAILRDGYWQGEACNRRKDGSEFVERLSVTAVNDREGRPHHYIGVFADITRDCEHRRLLERQSLCDALTGLPNRLMLGERLAAAIGRARIDAREVAVAFIDLDGFKKINDNYGHMAGDALLVTMAQRLRGALRQSDVLARYGGDEFVAILSEVDDGAMLAALIERLIAAAHAPASIAGREVTVSASVGVARYPRDGKTPAQVIERADAAMYAAKRAGRNCARYASGCGSAVLLTPPARGMSATD